MEMALAGCCDWTQASRLTAEHRAKEKATAEHRLDDSHTQEQRDEGFGNDSEDGSESSSAYVPTAELMPKDAMSDEEII